MGCNIVISIVVQGEIEGKRLGGDWTCQELGLACEVDKLYDFRKVSYAGQMYLPYLAMHRTFRSLLHSGGPAVGRLRILVSRPEGAVAEAGLPQSHSRHLSAGSQDPF